MVGFFRTLTKFGWPMSDDRLLFAALLNSLRVINHWPEKKNLMSINYGSWVI